MYKLEVEEAFRHKKYFMLAKVYMNVKGVKVERVILGLEYFYGQ